MVIWLHMVWVVGLIPSATELFYITIEKSGDAFAHGFGATISLYFPQFMIRPTML